MLGVEFFWLREEERVVGKTWRWWVEAKKSLWVVEEICRVSEGV